MTESSVAFGTRHGKEQVVGPILAQAGLQVVVPKNFPSDSFGTFTREVARHGDQLETARAKALAAAQACGLTRALASEGSYGPHPQIPFVPVGRELLLLIDLESELEIEGWWVGLETNFSSRWVYSFREAEEFGRSIGFPEHGLVVRVNPDSEEHLAKGICCREQLEAACTQILRDRGRVFLETDMRAMVNPTRMQGISLAAEDLLEALHTRCPGCAAMGFRVRDVVRGLPCSGCGFPTQLVKAELLICKKCGHRVQRPRTEISSAEPRDCQFCNP